MEDEEAQVGGWRKKHEAQAWPRLSAPVESCSVHGKKNAQHSLIGSHPTTLSLLSTIVISISLSFSGCRFMEIVLLDHVCSYT